MHMTPHAMTAGEQLRISNAVVAGELARARAARLERESWSPEQRARWQAELERRQLVSHEHRQRAHAAMKRQRKPRLVGPAPERTRRYCRPIAMDPVLDPRLNPGEARCLVLILSECGRYRQRLLTNGYLGNLLNRSDRQVQRYVSRLTELGYIKCWPQLHPVTKATIGRYIRPLAPCLPYWHPDGLGDIEKPTSRWNHCRDTADPHELPKSNRVFIEKHLSTSRNPAENPFRREPARYTSLSSFDTDDKRDSSGLDYREDEVRYGYDPSREARLSRHPGTQHASRR